MRLEWENVNRTDCGSGVGNRLCPGMGKDKLPTVSPVKTRTRERDRDFHPRDYTRVL